MRLKRRALPGAFVLSMYRHNGHMAMIGQLGSIGCFEHIRQERMFSGEGEYQIDLIISHELIDSVHEIKKPDEIELR